MTCADQKNKKCCDLSMWSNYYLIAFPISKHWPSYSQFHIWLTYPWTLINIGVKNSSTTPPPTTSHKLTLIPQPKWRSFLPWFSFAAYFYSCLYQWCLEKLVRIHLLLRFVLVCMRAYQKVSIIIYMLFMLSESCKPWFCREKIEMNIYYASLLIRIC